jgi:radical SAM protein with 4Fe4S-binding SPASM domain
LEFTNLCNANCIFCPYSQQTRAHEQMPESVFKKAVADYVAIGGGSVDVTPTVGDPLIHPKFVEWVRYLRALPKIDRITVTTNGILLDRHGFEEILDSGLSRINISLAGFDEAMYRRIYRNSSYKKVLSNVTRLLEANSKRADPVPIFLCLRPDRPPKEVLGAPDLQPLMKYRPNFSFVTLFSRSGGKIDKLPEGMALAPAEKGLKSAPCRSTFLTLMVQSTGDVQACACEASVNAPALVVGNIEQESLLEIWRGERLRSLRESFTNGQLNSTCASCDYSYIRPDFHLPAMRRKAKSSRQRFAGQIVRHTEPMTHEWQLD